MIIHARPDRGILGRNQSHPLQLWNQVPTSEHSIPLDIDLPLAARLRRPGRMLRSIGMRMRRRFGLVKVPVERDPQDHGNLSGRARGGLELGRRRVRDGRDEEVVALQRWLRVGMDMLGRYRRPILDTLPHGLLLLLLGGIQHDSPPHRKRIVMRIHLMTLEPQASKHLGNRESLPIGQMYNLRCHRSNRQKKKVYLGEVRECGGSRLGYSY